MCVVACVVFLVGAVVHRGRTSPPIYDEFPVGTEVEVMGVQCVVERYHLGSAVVVYWDGDGNLHRETVSLELLNKIEEAPTNGKDGRKEE